MNTKTRKIVLTAMFASLICVATMIIKVPSPLNGYINLGDAIVLLAGWMFSPLYAFMAAGIGSALADVFSSYFIYAPVTFVIKGLMALVAYYVFKMFKNKLGDLPSRIISSLIAEILMILGYYVFEGFLYGFIPSLANIPANGVQGVAGIIIGIMLIKVMEKSKIKFE